MVTLNQDKTTTEDKFYIYRDDVGVDIYVEFSNLEYQFNKKKNGYKKADVLFKTPSGDIYKVENLQIRETKIKFSFTQDIVDKMQEIGKYELQFEALPADCHIFDIIEDLYDTSTRYYGVRQAGNTFTVSNPKEHNHGNNKAQRISAIWCKVL